MIPEAVEPRLAALRRRVVTRPVARGLVEILARLPAPLAVRAARPERHEWLARNAPPAGPRRIVDLGCGPGSDLDLMAEATGPRLAVGVDRSAPLLAEAAARARLEGRRERLYVRADLSALPFAPRSFAWASCVGVLHRLAVPARALADVAGLVQPGGVLTCETPRAPEGRAAAATRRLLEAAAGVRLFSRDEVVSMLYAAGLHPLEVDTRSGVLLVAARRPAGHATEA